MPSEFSFCCLRSGRKYSNQVVLSARAFQNFIIFDRTGASLSSAANILSLSNDGVWLSEGPTDGIGLLEGASDFDGETDGSLDITDLGVSVGRALRDVENTVDGDRLLAMVGVSVGAPDGASLGASLGALVGEVALIMGDQVGEGETVRNVGPMVGVSAGESVGLFVGASIGPTEGAFDGDSLEASVGELDGALENSTLGLSVGSSLGWTDGDAIGNNLGVDDGTSVGPVVGDSLVGVSV